MLAEATTIVSKWATRSQSGRSGGISDGSREDRIPVELWSLAQALDWIETRADASQRPIKPTTVIELHEVLKAGTIAASGCVDGGERRAISPAEWHDYRLTLEHAMFLDHYYPGSSGMSVIAVLSTRSFPAGALKYHGHKSKVQIPSAQSAGGEPGYHRVIDDVRLQRADVVQQWPPSGRALPPNGPAALPARSRPKFEGALRAIAEIYPGGLPDQAAEPNSKLCRRVGEKLKAAGLPEVSDDTILRAAGRRRA